MRVVAMFESVKHMPSDTWRTAMFVSFRIKSMPNEIEYTPMGATSMNSSGSSVQMIRPLR